LVSFQIKVKAIVELSSSELLVKIADKHSHQNFLRVKIITVKTARRE